MVIVECEVRHKGIHGQVKITKLKKDVYEVMVINHNKWEDISVCMSHEKLLEIHQALTKYLE